MRIVGARALPVIVPTLVLVDVSATVGRLRGERRSERATRLLIHWSSITFHELDRALAHAAANLARVHRLRGADAVYAAVALQHDTTLVSRDRNISTVWRVLFPSRTLRRPWRGLRHHSIAARIRSSVQTSASRRPEVGPVAALQRRLLDESVTAHRGYADQHGTTLVWGDLADCPTIVRMRPCRSSVTRGNHKSCPDHGASPLPIDHCLGACYITARDRVHSTFRMVLPRLIVASDPAPPLNPGDCSVDCAAIRVTVPAFLYSALHLPAADRVSICADIVHL